MKRRDKMLNMILDGKPGIYFHVSFPAMAWFVAAALIVVALCVHTVAITINPSPVSEYPMFIDGKKIIFQNYEPRSIREAREILAKYEHHFKDGDFVAVSHLDLEDNNDH